MRCAKLPVVALAVAILGGCDPPAAPVVKWKPLDLGPQQLEMTFARLIPSTNRLSVIKGEDYIHSNELVVLSDFGLRGSLVARGYARRGQGKLARVLVVMVTNVTTAVGLPQPDATNGVYVQGEKGFVLLPMGTLTIAKKLRLEKYTAPLGDEETMWWIDMGSVIQGGTAWIWTEKTK